MNWEIIWARIRHESVFRLNWVNKYLYNELREMISENVDLY